MLVLSPASASVMHSCGGNGMDKELPGRPPEHPETPCYRNLRNHPEQHMTSFEHTSIGQRSAISVIKK